MAAISSPTVGGTNIMFVLANGTMHAHLGNAGRHLQEGPPTEAAE